MNSKSLIISGKIDWTKIENPKVKELYDNLSIATSNFTEFDNNSQPLFESLVKAVNKYPESLIQDPIKQEKLEQSNIKEIVKKSPNIGIYTIPKKDANEQINTAITNVISDKLDAKQKFKSSLKTSSLGDPKTLVFNPKEIYELYNSQISQDELDAWLIAYPKHLLNEYYSPKSSKEDLISKGLLMYDLEKDIYVYRYLYLSGDVSKRLAAAEKALLNKNYNKISESQLSYQISELQKVVPALKRVDAANPDDKIFLVPHTDFSKSYMVTKFKDGSFLNRIVNGAVSLYEAFQLYLRRLPEREFTIAQKDDVIKYVENKSIRLTEYDKRTINEEQQKELVEDRKQKAKNEGDKLFAKFLEEELDDFDIHIINSEWNQKFNGVVECEWSKIPVTFTFSKVFKGGDPLRLTDTQRNGVAYRQINKSGMLGYDVGVGKTITSIACTANAFAMGDASRALFVVPDATYKKWIMEISGGPDKDGFWIYGAVPQFNLLAFGNLNADITFNEIKEYTSKEKELIEFYISVKKEFVKILSKYPQVNNGLTSELLEELKLIFKTIASNENVEEQIRNYAKKIVLDSNLSYENLREKAVTFKVNIETEINICIYTLGKIKPIPENSIVLLNYTGMVRLGLGENSRFQLRNQLYKILTQGDLDPKDEAALTKKIDESIGTSMREARLFIDEMKIDMFVIDEAHNMKKSFTRVAGEPKGGVDDKGYVKREMSRYNLDSGQPSNQGIHAFCLSQYIQNIANGCNLMLTATPFTNNPLEVYSMLALSNYKRLVETNKENLKEFFDTFIREENQIVINAKNQPEVKPVVVGFRNLPQLRQIIYDVIDYKTGEDALVIRPEAISIPDTTKNKRWGGAEAYLQMNATQRMYMRKIQRYINDQNYTLSDVCSDALGNENMCTYTSDYIGDLSKLDNANEEAEATRVLRALSFQKLLAVSPYLFACNDLPCPTYKEYIEESPKLLYTMECIKSVKQWHETRGESVSGQVIYMNAGTRYFHLMKEYLVKEIGFNDNEVELIYGDISKEKKESIKERFLAGEVKIIIGSGTIKEGIDLQNKSTVLYIIIPDWNPTDYNQVKGRIWRQGNMYSYVRIVNVLMADTSDVFIYQKLQEKTLRLKELLDRNSKKSQLDLDDVNPEEIKENLITDSKVKASLQIKRFTKEKELEISVIKNELNRLIGLQNANQVFSNLHPKIIAAVNDFNNKYAIYIKNEDEKEDDALKQEFISKGKQGDYKSKFNPENEAYIPVVFEDNIYTPEYIERINRRLVFVMQKLKGSTINSANGLNSYLLQELISNWRDVKSDFIKGIETLAGMNLNLTELNDIIAKKEAKILEIQEEIKNLPAKLEELAESNESQREAYLKTLKSIDERVEEFAALNTYMQYYVKKPESIVTIEEVIENPASVENVVEVTIEPETKTKKVSKRKIVSTQKVDNDVIIKSIENRIEINKQMLSDDPSNKKVRNRIEILESMLEEQKSIAA